MFSVVTGSGLCLTWNPVSYPKRPVCPPESRIRELASWISRTPHPFAARVPFLAEAAGPRGTARGRAGNVGRAISGPHPHLRLSRAGCGAEPVAAQPQQVHTRPYDRALPPFTLPRNSLASLRTNSATARRRCITSRFHRNATLPAMADLSIPKTQHAIVFDEPNGPLMSKTDHPVVQQHELKPGEGQSIPDSVLMHRAAYQLTPVVSRLSSPQPSSESTTRASA